MKKIIIKTGVVKNINFEELLQLSNKVISFNIKRWANQFEYEELYQIATIAVWNAYKDYDINRGLCFSTVASRYIFNTISAEYRSRKRHNVRGSSLYEEFMEGLIVEDTVAESINPIDEFETNMYIDQLLDTREKTVLKLLSENYTQKQIAAALNTVQCSISRILKRIKNKFEKEGYRNACRAEVC